MKYFRTILCCLLLAVTASAGAQSRSEIRLYQKTIAKPSVKAYDRFLRKYPSSVFAPEIISGRDSLIFYSLNREDERAVENFLPEIRTATYDSLAREILANLRTSRLLPGEALAAIREKAPQGASVCASSYRKYGVEYIVGAILPAEGNRIEFLLLDSTSGGWREEKSFGAERNTMTAPESSCFVDEASLCSIASSDSRYFRFAYTNLGNGGEKAEYVLNLMDIESCNLFSAIFYGSNLLKPGQSGYRIEGQTTETISGGLLIPEQVYLNASLKENASLVQISDKDAWTDEAIGWWLEKNPKAQSSATQLSFGVLKEGCGIVEKFLKEPKESAAGYSAALFDIRGYTVVCAKNNGQYILVWCEKAPVNRKTDRLLNSIYFEKGSTLCLFYYQGKTTFKYRINLSSKSIKR